MCEKEMSCWVDAGSSFSLGWMDGVMNKMRIDLRVNERCIDPFNCSRTGESTDGSRHCITPHPKHSQRFTHSLTYSHSNETRTYMLFIYLTNSLHRTSVNPTKNSHWH